MNKKAALHKVIPAARLRPASLSRETAVEGWGAVAVQGQSR